MQTSPRTPAARCACRAKQRSAASGARPPTFVLAVTAVLSIKQKRAATRPLENSRLLVLEQGRLALFSAGAGLLIQRQRHLLLARLVLFVSVDDALHQMVPHHIALIEVHKRNPIHVAQNIRRFHQPAAPRVGQIELSDSAGHPSLGAVTCAGSSPHPLLYAHHTII